MSTTTVPESTVRLARALASTYSTVVELRRWARTWESDIGPEARAELDALLGRGEGGQA